MPVHEMLDAANPERPAWAVFDAQWYLQTFEQARDACGGAVEKALSYYLTHGAALGHSPSPLFDETYYLESNPDIVELIRQRFYRSGFDHFCQTGHRTVSPHWLFDDHLYGRLYEDMSLENLDLHGIAGRYDHYLRLGQFEGRQPHFLFDGAYYRKHACLAGVPAAEIDTTGSFTHYLRSLAQESFELPPSIYFDPEWYVANNFGVKLAIQQRRYRCAIEHYLRNETPGLFNPVPEFSEAYYHESNRDIAQAIEQGAFRSGYQHFVQFGAFELRRPHPAVDLVYYRDNNLRVADDLNTGAVRDAFAHLRLIGVPEHLVAVPLERLVEIDEQVTKKLFFLRASMNLPIFAKEKLDFRVQNPVISVILVAFNRFELTMQTLTSLRMNFSGAIQLILIDNGSADQTCFIDRYIDGACIIHDRENIGFVRAANLGLGYVGAPATLYLNNDVELGFRCIETALTRLAASADIGAVGGKIVRTHGKLQEAGSIIWNDGTTSGYLRDAPATVPEANFVREVDYCSGVFLCCRTDILRSLSGFDENFSPAYYEDADLCVRLHQAGFKIIYDPRIVVHHLEFGSATSSDVSMALMRRGQKIFAEKHTTYLARKMVNLPSNAVRARSNSMRKKLLFIEDTIPLRHLGSGFVRANDVVQAIAAAGYDVSILPMNGSLDEIVRCLADFPDSIEVLYDRNFINLPELLAERADYFDVIWVSRTHNLERILPLCRAAGLSRRRTRFILDTEAIVSLRDAVKAIVLDGSVTNNLSQALQAEFKNANFCDHVTAVNELEAGVLKGLGLPHVTVLGTARVPAPTPNKFADREGLLFVASIHQDDSPNLNSLYWFRDEIFPYLCQEMENPPVLNFVGYIGSGIDLSDFADAPWLVIHGPAYDLTAHYNQNRVFVAPTRFAAGTPYKLYEAASFGLPSVATDLLARQLGWRAGIELLSAPATDARAFAAQIATLYRTETIWTKLRHNAIERLETENDPATFNATVRTILEAASPAVGKHRAPRKPVPVG